MPLGMRVENACGNTLDMAVHYYKKSSNSWLTQTEVVQAGGTWEVKDAAGDSLFSDVRYYLISPTADPGRFPRLRQSLDWEFETAEGIKRLCGKSNNRQNKGRMLIMASRTVQLVS